MMKPKAESDDEANGSIGWEPSNAIGAITP